MDGLDGNGFLKIKDTHFQWKIKWRLEHLGAPGIMGDDSSNVSISPFRLTYC